ncbi:MAG: TolC family protein [Deltaproteobacteria bacterium]|nr:TolC family protein [Deltaproteobacteria bacterium]
MNIPVFRSARIVLTALLVTAVFSGICAAKSPIWAPPALSAIIEEGLSNNQSIKSMEASIDALSDQASVVGSLPDPNIGFSLLNLPVNNFRFDREPMTQKQVSISQQIPWLSKLGLRSETVSLRVKGETARLRAARLSLAQKIADAWYELGYVSKSLDINARLIDLVQQIHREAKSQYVVGKGLQQNIFQAQVELSRLADEKVMLTNKGRTLQDRLNALLNRKTYAALVPPVGLPKPAIDLTKRLLNGAALANNPDLSALRAEIERSETGIELAKKDYFPDWNVKLAYGQRDENRSGANFVDFFSATVQMSLPVWQKRKQDKNLTSALSASRAARDSYNNVADKLPHQVDGLATEIADANRRYGIYTDKLIPQAKQWARSAIDAYQVGKVDFDRMIDARIRVLRFELGADRLLYTIYQKRAALEELLGKPINANNADKADGSVKTDMNDAAPDVIKEGR